MWDKIHYYYKAWPKLFVAVDGPYLRVSFFVLIFPAFFLFLFLFFCSIFLFKFSIIFLARNLYFLVLIWLQSNGPQQKNRNTDRWRGGWGHRFLEILRKEHVRSTGGNTIQGVFMKNSCNFHWWSCWFRLPNFHQHTHNFTEFSGLKLFF